MTRHEDTDEGFRFSLTRTLTVGAVVSAVIAGGWFVVGNLNAGKDVDTAQANERGAVEQKEQVLEVVAPICDRPQLDAELTLLCAQAEVAERSPAPSVGATERVDYDRVQKMVDDALAQDPALSESALLALVRQVFAQNPPADGKTPSVDELLSYIRQVYAENPPERGEKGDSGGKGDAGQNAYCFDNPDDPACQPRQGAQGVSVVGFGFERTDDGQCVLAQVLENPADGQRQTIRLPIPDSMCAPVAEPTETVPPLLGGG